MELSLYNLHIQKLKNSLIAASVMYLVRKIKKDLTVWSDKLKEFTLYEEAKVREVAKIICSQLESVDEGKMKIVKEKYSDEKYCAVGNIRVQRVQRSKTRVY